MTLPQAQYLDRVRAAEWFAERGITTVTVKRLGKLAAQGKGPPFQKLGRYVYYTPGDLEAWLETELRPATRDRRPPAAA